MDKQATPDLAEALYQGKGIVTKQVSASTVEVKISGDESITERVTSSISIFTANKTNIIHKNQVFLG